MKKYIVEIYIVLVILIISITNIVIRNNRISELENQVNKLNLEIEYILEGINVQITEQESERR